MPEYDEGEKFIRDYHDVYNVSELAELEIMPKYFDDDASKLKVGLEGMLTEYVGDVTEDAFNTGSTLLMETFPTRANFTSSIYSNASIFQFSDVFANAAECNFVIQLDESDIRKNFIQTKHGKYRHFYIDKDTMFYIQEIPFCLDYDIKITAKYAGEKNGKALYNYSAQYDLSGVLRNSISNIKTPYIVTKLTADGKIILHVDLKQVVRKVIYEDTLENTTVNAPKITIRHEGDIAGIDVLYMNGTENDYNTQLEIKPVYSLPSTEPFCYFKRVDDERIDITFTPKDGYFKPKFNSKIKIIAYQTLGAAGNFKTYHGTDIVITKNGETYDYEYPWRITGVVNGGSKYGKDSITKEDLRSLTVEGFSTARAITTNHDLDMYFKNFPIKYGGSKILFLKKRDDAVERLFSAFLFVHKDEYFYPTNTLTLYSNLLKFDFNPIGYYHISPGYLFGYKTEPVYYLPVKYHSVFDYNDYYASDNKGNMLYYENGVLTAPRVTLTEKQVLDKVKLEELVAGDVQWYKVDGDAYALYCDKGKVEGDEASRIDKDTLLEMFINNKVTFGRKYVEGEEIEFITDDKKEASYRKAWLRQMPVWKENNNYDKELTLSDYAFNYPFSQYIQDNKIDTRISAFDGVTEETVANKDFAFTNPFLIQITKDTGLVGYYLTYIDETYSLDFNKENDDDAFVQFISYDIENKRLIGKDKRYTLRIKINPSVTAIDIESLVKPELYFNPEATSDIDTKEKKQVNQFIIPNTGYTNQPKDLQTYNKELLSENNLRVVLSFYDNETKKFHGYMEMIPVEYEAAGDNVIFEATIETDDFITDSGRFRVVHRCPYCGHIVTASANHNVPKNDYYCTNCSSFFKEGIINVLENDDIFLPIAENDVHITILYKNPEEEVHPTDNEFAIYDSTYEGYRWTNVYTTSNNPITFIEPMNMIRGILEYQDFYENGVEALDIRLFDMPLLKWSLLEYRDRKMEVTDPLLADDVNKFYDFMSYFKETYDYLDAAKLDLRNCTNIDCKFYNTYGRSNNFVIGENNEYIDTNNIAIYFKVWVVANTDLIDAKNILKDHIKEYIESINDDLTNDLYISNLITSIEDNIPFVHHLKFRSINDYPTTYQSIKNTAISLNELSKEERRHFVPELLVINRNNIFITIEETNQ